MKLNNKSIIKKWQITIYCICAILFALLFITDYSERLIIFSLLIIFALISITSKVSEFDNSGECISFRRYHFFKSGFIAPVIEVPNIYLKDYYVSRILITYYITLQIYKGSGGIRHITFPLVCFKHSDILNILKFLQSVKAENIALESKIASEMFKHGNILKFD